MNQSMDEEIQYYKARPVIHRVLNMKAIGKIQAYLSMVAPTPLLSPGSLVTNAASVDASHLTLPTSQSSENNAGSQVTSDPDTANYLCPLGFTVAPMFSNSM